MVTIATVPDLPGGFTAGRWGDETLDMAQEAIELHLEGLIDEALPVPSPGTIEVHQSHREFKDGNGTADQHPVRGQSEDLRELALS